MKKSIALFLCFFLTLSSFAADISMTDFIGHGVFDDNRDLNRYYYIIDGDIIHKVRGDELHMV